MRKTRDGFCEGRWPYVYVFHNTKMFRLFSVLDDLLSVVLDGRILHSDHAYINRLLHIQDTDARCGCDLFSRLVIILCVFELCFFAVSVVYTYCQC